MYTSCTQHKLWCFCKRTRVYTPSVKRCHLRPYDLQLLPTSSCVTLYISSSTMYIDSWLLHDLLRFTYVSTRYVLSLPLSPSLPSLILKNNTSVDGTTKTRRRNSCRCNEQPYFYTHEEQTGAIVSTVCLFIRSTLLTKSTMLTCSSGHQEQHNRASVLVMSSFLLSWSLAVHLSVVFVKSCAPHEHEQTMLLCPSIKLLPMSSLKV